MAHENLEQRLTTLLEAERAGVFAARALYAAAEDSAEKDLMALILDGERESCRLLGRTLLHLGSRGSSHIGDFAQKVLALDDTLDRLRLLVRGQEWVVRRIDEALEVRPPAQVTEPLRVIRDLHDLGIGKCRDYLEGVGDPQARSRTRM